ncbi:hypothetical protein L1787_06045 [Acuticoccus sp. M5D2P5]|uniref:hypothetical protein n=1 Tax=Acuticoccus kalidii TaxID=2910977 RepID=UPI001F17C94F|nr:hypothetical protein [Acuticoccus kalidii]MCF3932975.1 hypothetical protein [Acuticoccus kalidii]
MILVTGAHRLEAMRPLGIESATFHVINPDETDPRLWEIDENLCRAELSPSERAELTARRKAIYEELHPETKEHVAGGKARHASAADKLSAATFAKETARSTGREERSIRRDAERGAKVCPEAMALIRGTKLDTGILRFCRRLEAAHAGGGGVACAAGGFPV